MKNLSTKIFFIVYVLTETDRHINSFQVDADFPEAAIGGVL